MNIQTGEWYYVVGQFDGNKPHVYVNGNLMASATTSITGISDSTANFTIGRY